MKATGEDLCYLLIEKVDEDGIVNPIDQTKISITVEGAASLEALANANPTDDENFFDPARTPFGGQVLAVIRSAEQSGTVTVRVSDGTYETVKTLTVEA